MRHEILRLQTHISQQLRPLSLLHNHMLTFANALIEVLMIQTTPSPPSLINIHEHEMVAMHHEFIGNVERRAAAEVGGLLVDELFDCCWRAEYYSGAGAEFEREYAAVFGGPFCESSTINVYLLCGVMMGILQMDAGWRDLMEIADKGKTWRPWTKSM